MKQHLLSKDTLHWKTLLNTSKIRNGLLHANGRIDIDKYGIDTTETIKTLNSDANTILIEILNLKGNSEGASKIKLKEEFLNYCVIKIKNFESVHLTVSPHCLSKPPS